MICSQCESRVPKGMKTCPHCVKDDEIARLRAENAEIKKWVNVQAMAIKERELKAAQVAIRLAVDFYRQNDDERAEAEHERKELMQLWQSEREPKE